MIKLTDDPNRTIWVGNSNDETMTPEMYRSYRIGGLLNTAIDLFPTRGWHHKIEAMHVGLADGPGNELSTYCAAVMALHALTRRHNTLVVCHGGTRSLAVVVMYTVAKSGGTWEDRLALLQERYETDFPPIHEAHREACGRIGTERLKALLRVVE